MFTIDFCLTSTLARNRAVLAVAATLAASAFTASATSVLPGSFANGTDISTLTPGVTLSAPDNSPDTAVYAVDATTWGAFFFGYNGAQSGLQYYWLPQTPPGPFRADFTSPVSSVSVGFSIAGSNGYGYLAAFDASNNFLASQQTPAVADFSGTLSISTPGISYILAGFQNTGGDDLNALTSLEFQTSSPVPDSGGTLFLLGLSCLPLLSLARRARKRALA